LSHRRGNTRAHQVHVWPELLPFRLPEAVAPPTLEYRKPKALPHVADEVKQAEFIAFYEALMNNFPADEAVYFADAVHPEHQTKPARGLSYKRLRPFSYLVWKIYSPNHGQAIKS